MRTFLAVLAILILAACQSGSQKVKSTAFPTATSSPPAATAKVEEFLPTYTIAPIIHLPAFTSTPRKQAAVRVKTSMPSPTPTLIRPYPVEHSIKKISGHRQYFALGCETSAALDWAEFFGVNLNEYGFQRDLGLSDNPEKGFVGDVNGDWGQIPPHDYGVHAGPVAELLRKHHVPAQAYKEFTLEQLKMEIASDEPVIAWVIGNMANGVPVEYIDAQGNRIRVAAYEHVVLITGYNEETGHIRYLNNGHFYDVPTDVFLNSWGVLENMVIVREEPAT